MPGALGGARAWLVFIAVASALQLAWQAVHDTALGRGAITLLAVEPAAALIDLLDPELGVSAQGAWIRALGGSIHVRNGCDGADLAILLLAAFAAAALPARRRLAGLVAGALLVFVLNQARIVALFFALRSDPAWFATLHGTVLPVAVVLTLVTYFQACLAWSGPRHADA